MSHFHQPLRPWLLAVLAAAGLNFAACDHAKDLVEQGKQQAADLQKSIEETAEESSTGSAPAAVSTAPAASSTPTVTSPAASPTVTAPAAPVPAQDYAQMVEQFMKLDPLGKTDQMLLNLGAMPDEFRARVTECDLTGSPVTDVGLVEVAKFPNLFTIKLIHCRDITNHGIGAIQDLSGLEQMRLDSTKVTDAGMKHLRNLTRLKVLGLGQTAVTDAGVANLRELPQLEELYLTSTSMDGSGFRKANLGASLRILKADGSSFGVAGMNSLAGHKNLEDVDLTRAKVSDKTVGSLKGLGKLRSLKLNHNPLSDQGVKQLTGLSGLEELSLGGTSITDNCLTAFRPCKNLRYFDVRSTLVTAIGREYILKIAPHCAIDHD